MNKYTYIDHGDVPPDQYHADVVLFECRAENIMEADKKCRTAGHNPMAWHIGTRIDDEARLRCGDNNR